MTPVHPTGDDPAAAVAVLKETFPGVPIWYGTSTRHYWALVRGQLVGADHPAQLARILDDVIRAWPRPPTESAQAW